MVERDNCTSHSRLSRLLPLPSRLLHLLHATLLLFICLTNNEGHNEGGANDVGIVYSTAKCNRRAVSRGPDLLFMADLTGNGNAKLQKRNKV